MSFMLNFYAIEMAERRQFCWMSHTGATISGVTSASVQFVSVNLT